MRIRVLADRLVDDPVMVAASLRLGTTTVRDDHPGWLSIGCLLSMISPRRGRYSRAVASGRSEES